MATPRETRFEHREVKSSLSPAIILWLAISWLWVGVPLAWGVTQTVIKSQALFVAPVAAPAINAAEPDKNAPVPKTVDAPQVQK